MRTIKLCFFIILFFVGVSWGEQKTSDNNDMQFLQQQIKEMQQQMKESNERNAAEIKMLKEEIELLKQKNAAVPAAPATEANTPAPGPAANKQPMQPSYGGGGGLPGNLNVEYPGGPAPGQSNIYQNFNPDISGIGDFIFQGTSVPKGETPTSLTGTNKSKAQLREVEFGFSNPVDPYGRLDLILSIERNDDGSYSPDIEEGFFTYTDLPYDLQARVGKFYSVFGVANMYHTHALPWVDRPLPIRTFFGDEGLNDGGAEISWLVPNPWNAYIELTQDVQSNGNETEFVGLNSTATNANGLMYVTHLKNYFDLDKDSTLQLGGSFATGADRTSSNSGSPATNVEGLDLTYKWKPYGEGLYKSVTWISEALFNQKDEGNGNTVDAQGWYSSLEYQFARQWSVFGRYDYTQYPDNSNLHENSYSAGVTFQQSEFMFWRLQYEHTTGENFAGDVDRDQIFLQADFLIGLHPAHKY